MAQKREILFETLYGGADDADISEMLDGNRDRLSKNIKDEDQPLLKEGRDFKTDNDISVNGKDYHISLK